MSKFKYTLEERMRQANVPVEVQLLFNRNTGNLINALAMTVEQVGTLPEHIVLFTEHYSLNTHEPVGGIIVRPDGSVTKNYELKEKALKPMEVNERDFDDLTACNITDRYCITKQINILAESIFKIAETTGTELPELTEMVEFIREMKDEGKRYKEQYLKKTGAKCESYINPNDGYKGETLEGKVF